MLSPESESGVEMQNVLKIIEEQKLPSKNNQINAQTCKKNAVKLLKKKVWSFDLIENGPQNLDSKINPRTNTRAEK